ncbi:uncharacterized protein LOC142174489 [Nicotiana tabacum]|uniref:Uncharacterized protein LOC142174489 n=1 Tax=Nicotiana tabacum TaxID=4097 RepID=A0AC58TGR1_TOBAC
MARTLRFQGGIPLHFWGDCVLAAVYLINRLPSSVLNGKSPYEVFHKSPPSLLHLRVIGCLCFATITRQHDKLLPKAVTTVHMGYSTSQKGYRLYSLKDKKFFVSRDVTFREDVFPFLMLKEGKVPPLFFEANGYHATEQYAAPQQHNSIQEMQTPNHELDQLHVEHDATISQLDDLSSNDAEEIQTIEIPHEETSHRQLRRTSRGSKPPVWTKDYICPTMKPSSSTYQYPLSNYMGYDSISNAYQGYLTAISTDVEPTSYH